jgi:hypothetical protein
MSLFDLFSNSLIYFFSTTGAKDMPFAQDRTAAGTFRLNTLFEMHNNQSSIIKVYVTFFRLDGFGNTRTGP